MTQGNAQKTFQKRSEFLKFHSFKKQEILARITSRMARVLLEILFAGTAIMKCSFFQVPLHQASVLSSPAALQEPVLSQAMYPSVPVTLVSAKVL